MPLFVLFVFGAVIVGAGAMIAPAWPTPQPRIGLGAAFSLAIIIGGTVFWASLFGWEVLVIDYLLFALVTGIFLGGTLSVGQARAEARGEVLEDHEQGWPGPQDLGFFAVVAILFAAPVFLFPVTPGTDAATYGYLALTTREGGTFNTFAPFHPDVTYLYSPGFGALIAYLSGQLNQSITVVQASVGAVLALLNVWIAYDFGAELQDKRLGRAMALAMLLSLGLLGSLLNGHYPALLGLLFMQAFFVYAIRYLNTRYPADLVAAGLMLGATAIAHPGMTITAALGFVPWLATMWLGQPRPSVRMWLVVALGIPLIAIIATSPWLAELADALNNFQSPLLRSPDNLIVMLQYHGVWIFAAVVLGAWLGWVRRDPVAILAVGWLLLILDFSTTGGIAALLPVVDRYVNPLDLAWHAPIVPYSILGGMGLLWLWENVVQPRTGSLTYRQTYVINGVLALVIVGAVLLGRQIAPLMAQVVGGPGVLASAADESALWWLRDNADSDVRVLNAPGNAGLWAAVISERDAVYYPLPVFATESPTSQQEQAALQAFWQDPADPANHDLLLEQGIDYVVVPQAMVDAEADTPWDWGDLPEIEPASSISNADYLEPAYSADGVTLVYRVMNAGE